MNCLILVPSLKRAGAETQAIDLANGLSTRGHRVHLCTFERELDQRVRVANSVSFHHVRRKSKYDLSLINSISSIIDREQIEVVQGVMQFATLVAWMAARRSSRQPPVVGGIHTTINRGTKEELQDRIVYRRILRRIASVVFVCNFQRDYWLKRFSELKQHARVVYNGVDARRLRRCDFVEKSIELRRVLAIPDTAFVFACIAAFRPEKGHGILIEAFSQLPAQAHLLLAGDGPERLLAEARVHREELGGRVHFLGNVDDVRPVIVASNATVLSSTAVETFSMAMLESMCLEVPMIATRIGGVEEAIDHRETGLLCQPGDSKALTQQMRLLLENPSEAAKLGAAAAHRISQSFTLEGMVSGYEAVFTETVTSSPVETATGP